MPCAAHHQWTWLVGWPHLVLTTIMTTMPTILSGRSQARLLWSNACDDWHKGSGRTTGIVWENQSNLVDLRWKNFSRILFIGWFFCRKCRISLWKLCILSNKICPNVLILRKTLHKRLQNGNRLVYFIAVDNRNCRSWKENRPWIPLHRPIFAKNCWALCWRWW